jgi:hypothetical protein
MRHAGAHVDLFRAAETLRVEASAKERIADFMLRLFLALLVIGAGLLSFAGFAIGICSVASLIVHSISIVSGN